MDPTQDPVLATGGGTAWVWSTVIICVGITGVQSFQLYRHLTKLRAVCFICSLTTIGCAIFNACRPYSLFPEYGYIAFFMFLTAIYVLFSNMALLDLGKQFYPDKRLWGEGRMIALLLVAVLNGFSLALSLFTSVFYLVIRRVHECFFAIFCVCFGLTIFAGLAGANYAFSPLMAARRKHKTATSMEAYAVGFWYLAIDNICALAYGIFYIAVLARGQEYFMQPNCHGVDFIFRAIFSLIHSCSPPRSAIAFLRRRFFASAISASMDTNALTTPLGCQVSEMGSQTIKSKTRLPTEEYDLEESIGGNMSSWGNLAIPPPCLKQVPELLVPPLAILPLCLKQVPELLVPPKVAVKIST